MLKETSNLKLRLCFLFFSFWSSYCNVTISSLLSFSRKNTISSLGAVQACSHLFSLFLCLFLREGEEMERMKDGRKEGGRKEGSEGERKINSIKTQSPTMFFKEELAPVC